MGCPPFNQVRRLTASIPSIPFIHAKTPKILIILSIGVKTPAARFRLAPE